LLHGAESLRPKQVSQLGKKFPAFYATPSLIIPFHKIPPPPPAPILNQINPGNDVNRGEKQFVGELQSQGHFLLYKYHQNGSDIEPGSLQ